MHRFYCPSLSDITISATDSSILSANALALDADETHHARKVLRVQTGETIVILDGKGRSATARITAYTAGRAVLQLFIVTQTPPPAPRIDLAVTLPKGPRADDMVNAVSQLGVTTIIPLRSERSTVDPRDNKLDRYQRAAIESAKQSGRAHFMQVHDTLDFKNALAMDHDLKLIAHPRGEHAAELMGTATVARRVLVLIGPEGGWTDEELAQAGAAGCRVWRFSPHILRIETAAVAAVAILGTVWK